MPIRWKVTTNDRKSLIVHDVPSLCLHYPPNTIVHAKKNSLGIAVFETEKQAKRSKGFLPNYRKILRVRGIGRGRKPSSYLPRVNQDNAARFLKKLAKFGIVRFLRELDYGWHTPEGTILYRAIEVLE